MLNATIYDSNGEVISIDDEPSIEVELTLVGERTIEGYVGEKKPINFPLGGDQIKVSFNDGTEKTYTAQEIYWEGNYEFLDDEDPDQSIDVSYVLNNGDSTVFAQGENTLGIYTYINDEEIKIGDFDALGVKDDEIEAVSYHQTRPIVVDYSGAFYEEDGGYCLYATENGRVQLGDYLDVTYTDGTTKRYKASMYHSVGVGFVYVLRNDKERISYYLTDDVEQEASWEPGKTYQYPADYRGHQFMLNVKVVESAPYKNVTAIEFSPNGKTTLYSEDLIAIYDDGTDIDEHISLEARGTGKHNEESLDLGGRFFAEGDTITLHYQDGSAETYTYDGTVYTFLDNEGNPPDFDWVICWNDGLDLGGYDEESLIGEHKIQISYGWGTEVRSDPVTITVLEGSNPYIAEAEEKAALAEQASAVATAAGEAAAAAEPGTQAAVDAAYAYKEAAEAFVQAAQEAAVAAKTAYGEKSNEYQAAIKVMDAAQTQLVEATAQAAAAHVHYYEVVVTAATCTEPGEKTYTCSVCEETKTETIAALGHDTEHYEEKAATCQAAGNIEYWTCKREGCGKYFIDEACENEITAAETVIAKIEHTAGEPVRENEVAAICQVAGSYDEVVYCTLCNTEISRTTKSVNKLGHTEIMVVGKAATCTETGLTEGKKCSVCGEILQAQTVIPALGHTPGAAVKENEIKATSSSAGSYDEVVYCSVCNAEISRTKKTTDKLPPSEAEKAAAEKAAKELETAKSTAKADLAKKYDKSAYKTAQQTDIDKLLKDANAAIDAAKDQTGVKSAVTEAEAKLSAVKTSAQIDKEEAAKFKVSVKSATLPLKYKQKIAAGANLEMTEGDAVVSVTSSNPKAVTVAGTTIKAGKKKGTSVITVTLKSGLTATYNVKVQKAKVKGKIAIECPTNVTLTAGETLVIGATKTPVSCTDKFKYTSSKKKTASVSKSGVIAAKNVKKKAAAKITIKLGKSKKTIKVTVLPKQ